MKHIHIERQHKLSLLAAKQLAEQWKQSGESEWQLKCEYVDGESCETIAFKRSGINGTLIVTEKQFTLSAQLGFLLKPYKDRIAQAIDENLTECLDNFQPSK